MDEENLTSPPAASEGPALTPAPPLYLAAWRPPSRLATMLGTGVTLTIRLTPVAVMLWMMGPDELKYAVMKYARYGPWALRYAAWWLRQEGW